jgi:methyl-accepting chemotaxis protein
VAKTSQRAGLIWAIFGVTAVAMVMLVLVLIVVVPSQAERLGIRTLDARGHSLAKDLAKKWVALPATSGPAEIQSEITQVTSSELDILNVWVFNCSERTCTEDEVLATKKGTLPATTAAALEAYNARGSTDAPVTLNAEVLLTSERVALKNGAAAILVAVDRRDLNSGLSELRRTMFVALALSVAVFLALVFILSRLLIVRPIRSMMNMAQRLSEADLSGRVEPQGTREFDELADSLNNIGQGLRDTLGRVRGVAESVAQVVDSISRTASNTSGGSLTVLTRVEETSSAMVQMLSNLKGIAGNVENLYQSAEESSSSILEMATTNDEVAVNVTKMSASVEETTSAIEQMTSSVKQVAHSIEDLAKSTEGTSSAIREMDVAIGQVETNAYETARLSEQVTKDAETGMESIQKTIGGIDKIKDNSKGATLVMEKLGRRIGEIGNIVDVIDDVAEQTNLLALNAAIIAAQAGEHGKGFAVVAEEIKDLSERTAASTKEIADLIRDVQSESKNALLTMNQGVKFVEDGVVLGRETEGALKKIQDSARESTKMVKAIARATVEQARGSKDVTQSVEQINEALTLINRATNEQARGAEQVMKGADAMKALTQHVKRSVDEQSHGSKQISRSIENINEMATHLNRAQKEQTRGTEQVLKAVDTIKTVAEQQNKSVNALEEAIETLRQQADVLRGEIRRFRV